MSNRAALEMLAHGLDLALTGVRKLLTEPSPEEWVDQVSSPLGRRRHCDLANKGQLAGARKVNGHWLVRRKVIDEYIESHGGTPSPAAASEAEDDAAILAFRAPKRGGRKQ